MVLPGSYKGKIQDFGVKWYQERDEYKAFIVFEVNGETVTWFGSLDPTEKTGKNGKPYSFLGITKGALKTAGFMGADIGDLADNTSALQMGKEFLVTISKTMGKNGTEYTNVNFEALGEDGKAVVKSGKGVDVEGLAGANKLREKLGLPHRLSEAQDIPF